MPTILLHAAEDRELIEADIQPLFGDRLTQPVVFDMARLPQVEDGSTIVCYLSDANLRLLLPVAAERCWRLGLLPHPEMKSARAGFGIASKMADAVEDVLKDEGEEQVDILRCNGATVLNSLVIGDPLASAPVMNSGDGIGARLKRLRRMLHFLLHTPPIRCKMETAKGQKLETAALGIVVVEHGRSAVLSRRVLEDSALADGMLHCLIYAPRSILMMLWFVVRSAVTRKSSSGKATPSFVGHIKTESLTIETMRPVKASADGEALEDSRFELTVMKGALLLIPGRHLDIEAAATDPKEVFKPGGVPTGDILESLKDKHLPWINRATPEEFRELFQVLRKNAKPSESYIVLMVLATMLATLGLFADSPPVIIGAMILAPMMGPIVAMSMGVLRTTEPALLRDSAKSLAIGVLLAIGCTVVLTVLTPLRSVNSEIAARLNPTVLDMGVAMVSGMAGVYAHARAEIAKSLAGVAIAVALVPPLAVTGIGLGWGDADVFLGAGLLFLTNLAGMTLAAAGTFLIMGYSPFTYSRRGVLVMVAFVLLVTALLVPSFSRMVDDHNIQLALDGWESPSGVIVREVKITHTEPIGLSVQLIDSSPIGMERLDEIKGEIEERLGRKVKLEAQLGVLRR
ncbi:MAG: DUF389 domain-containing protein [Phycisphaerales bacterium JB050]